MSKYILQIDTATEVCSVSVSADGQLLAEHTTMEANVHASLLTVFIDSLLKELDLGYNDLSAIAVSMGPGSYTGLRIGVSAAKGLCYALDIPLIGINTLESMFEGYSSSNELKANTLYIPMLDARRMEVYMSVFDNTKECIEPTAAVVVDSDTFDVLLPRKVVVFGSGAIKLLNASFSEGEQLRIDEAYQHSSAYLSKIASVRLKNNQVEDLVYFEPYYLKEFVATVSKKQF